ncbi:hypothetical protein H8959_013708 [Pygathrix nigripes]
MDTPSPDPLPSPLPGEEEKPLALPPPVPRGRRGRRPGGATSSNRTLKASSLPRKRGRPPKSGQEPPLVQVQGVTAPVGSSGGSDLLLIDDQGVPYTVSEGHLRRHCNIHAGLRPFRCPLCPRRFREAGELAHHHRVHSGERPYQCPICRLRFTEANTLRRHAKRKHPEAMGVPLCAPDPGSEPPWDEEGIPATAGAEEEEETEGKGEPA